MSEFEFTAVRVAGCCVWACICFALTCARIALCDNHIMLKHTIRESFLRVYRNSDFYEALGVNVIGMFAMFLTITYTWKAFHQGLTLSNKFLLFGGCLPALLIQVAPAITGINYLRTFRREIRAGFFGGDV